MNDTDSSEANKEPIDVEADNKVSVDNDEGEEDIKKDRQQLKEDLKQKQEEIDRLKSLAQRVKADFDNYKKKRKEEESAIRRRAKEELIKKLLDPLDGLRSALDLGIEAQSPQSSQGLEQEEWERVVRGFYEGIENVLQQFQQVLEAESIETINPEGEPFDSQEHEAVGVRQGSKDKDGLVAEVMQLGYKYQDHVIRPARVFVYQASAETGADDEQEDQSEGEKVEDKSKN